MKLKTKINASVCGTLVIALMLYLCGFILENLSILMTGFMMTIIFIITLVWSERYDIRM